MIDKCWQSVSSVSLRNSEKTFKESLVANGLIYHTAQDDVYQRLSPYLELLYENKVFFWHASCYGIYTSVQNIRYTSNKALNVVKADGNEPSPRVSKYVGQS